MKNRSNEPPVFTNREFAEGWRLLFGGRTDEQIREKIKDNTDKFRERAKKKPKEKPKMEKDWIEKDWEEATARHKKIFGETVTKIRGGLLIGPCYPVQVDYDSNSFQLAFFRSKAA